MANAMEQALLLTGDMADLRSLRKHEVFHSLKKDLALESPLIRSFILKMITVSFVVVVVFLNHCTFFLERLFKLPIELRSW